MNSLISIFVTVASLSVTSMLLANTAMLVPISPALSPDGSSLVFSWENDLWKISTDPKDDSPAQRLTIHPAKEYNPIFSPDGTTLFYNSDMEGSMQVFSMPLDKSSPPKQISFHSVENILEDVAIDSSKISIIYRSARDTAGKNPFRVYKNSANADKPEQLLMNASCHSAKISPDGSKFLITREGADTYRTGYHGAQAIQTWLYDIASKSYTKPVSNNYGCQSPLWLPDGSGFYFVSGEGGNFNLWKHDFSSSSNTQLTHHKDSNVMFPSISLDGSTIVYRHLFHYYKFNTKTKKISKLTPHHNLELLPNKSNHSVITKTKDADFSPSGLEIAFSANGNIFAMDTILKEPVQLTDNAEYETNIFFGENGSAIYYINDDGIKNSINKIAKSDPRHYWWETSSVITSTIIEPQTNTTIKSFTPSPDGKSMGYSTSDGKLFIFDLDTKETRLIAQSWNTPSFQWSPNSEWITYSVQNNNFNSDIYVTPADGSEEPVNITKHPDNEFAPSFSPDGKKLAFVGKRHGDDFDLYYVDLTPNGSEKSDREKKIQMAKSAMKKDPIYAKASKKSKPIIAKHTPSSPMDDDDDETSKMPDSTDQPDAESVLNNSNVSEKSELDKPQPEITFTPVEQKKYSLDYELTDVQKRIQRIPLNGTSLKQIFWKHDSSAILVQSKKWGNTTYAYDLESAELSKFADSAGVPIRYDSNGNLFWISNSIPSILKGGKSTSYKFAAQTEFNHTQHQQYKFRLIWRTTRDNFYDENMNGRNWDAILTKYEEAATQAKSSKSFDRIVAMLLGELNASHTGYLGNDTDTWTKQSPWKDEMLHLGVKHIAKEDGWHITNILSDSPASGMLSRLDVGDVITKINGTTVNDKTIQNDVLWGQLKDLIKINVRNEQGIERTVKLTPISYTTAFELASADQITENKMMVEKFSDGKFGYIHVARMQWDEFKKFEQHLYENGEGKDGIIIDVRDNGGGFTTDHLLTALTQPRHSYTVPRNGDLGYPQDRFVYATWEKPIVVLCNQNSFSNAEIFAHAIKNLDRGKLVGTPTAGGVISTGAEKILNEGILRIPFRGWFLSDSGEDMELYGASPDRENIIWARPGDIESGIDKQIEKAVDVLTEEVATKQENPITPKYRNRNDHSLSK